MRKVNILGRKVSVLAILMAVLVIGTASAAVFMNYATLTGQVTVNNAISVNNIVIDGEGSLTFSDSSATFTINNVGDEPVIVDLLTTLKLGEIMVTDYAGLTVDYSVIVGSGVEGARIENEGDITGAIPVLVPPGGLTIDVTFDATDNVIPGDYTIQVDVNVNGMDYDDFTGDNEMVDIRLTHKTGPNTIPAWETIGEISSMSYAPMGDEFYFELDAVGLVADKTYSLIYYADPWPGNNPGAVIGDSQNAIDGDIGYSGNFDLGMNLPTTPDDNVGAGAKVWVVVTDHLTGGTSMPMITYDFNEYLTEYSEIDPAVSGLPADFTDLVRYTDTNL